MTVDGKRDIPALSAKTELLVHQYRLTVTVTLLLQTRLFFVSLTRESGARSFPSPEGSIPLISGRKPWSWTWRCWLSLQPQYVVGLLWMEPKEQHHLQSLHTGQLSSLSCVLTSCPLKPQTGVETSYTVNESDSHLLNLMSGVWTQLSVRSYWDSDTLHSCSRVTDKKRANFKI